MWITRFLRECERILGIIRDAWKVSIFLREYNLQSGLGDPQFNWSMMLERKDFSGYHNALQFTNTFVVFGGPRAFLFYYYFFY